MNIWNILGSTSPKKSQGVIADIHSKSFQVAWEQHHFQPLKNWCKSFPLSTSDVVPWHHHDPCSVLASKSLFSYTWHTTRSPTTIPEPNGSFHPTHHFAEDLGIPAWHFLQGFQRHQAQLRRQKLHQQGLRRFLGGNQVVTRKWNDSGLVVKMRVFFLLFFC